jgi:hypothetical protein
VNEQYSVDYEATDIDPTADHFTWTLDTNATWLSIDANTGVLSGIPDGTQIGTSWVKVNVSDGNGGSDQANFTLTVNDTPDVGEEEPDADNDGMPDSWENKYGLDPFDPSDAHRDEDDDGLNNLEEYQNGSDPLSASFLKEIFDAFSDQIIYLLISIILFAVLISLCMYGLWRFR